MRRLTYLVLLFVCMLPSSYTAEKDDFIKQDLLKNIYEMYMQLNQDLEDFFVSLEASDKAKFVIFSQLKKKGELFFMKNSTFAIDKKGEKVLAIDITYETDFGYELEKERSVQAKEIVDNVEPLLKRPAISLANIKTYYSKQGISFISPYEWEEFIRFQLQEKFVKKYLEVMKKELEGIVAGREATLQTFSKDVFYKAENETYQFKKGRHFVLSYVEFVEHGTVSKNKKQKTITYIVRRHLVVFDDKENIIFWLPETISLVNGRVE